jgi:hypothetical protein
VLPAERIAHLRPAGGVALRDFDPPYARFGSLASEAIRAGEQRRVHARAVLGCAELVRSLLQLRRYHQVMTNCDILQKSPGRTTSLNNLRIWGSGVRISSGAKSTPERDILRSDRPSSAVEFGDMRFGCTSFKRRRRRLPRYCCRPDQSGKHSSSAPALRRDRRYSPHPPRGQRSERHRRRRATAP